ncbi:MAG: HAMP domain-containing protein [Saprospiraceae bacterium]|nr:HAMP domain-containing protein [Saprospiraceae bacterium]
MKIRAKLTLWVGFLFLLIMILVAVAVFYTNQISNDTQNILTDNYKTLEYSRQMLLTLDDISVSDSAIDVFESLLNKQQQNITEIGELELTTKLIKDFEKLKSSRYDSLLTLTMRKDLSNLMHLNMQAIERKSELAKESTTTATIMISVIGAFCFILAFTLLINLPSNIANPIKELTNSVKEIAAKNYSQRVHFEQHNEFGELAHSFNIMAEKLEQYNNSSLAKLMNEKRRIETLINNMHDPVIGLDESLRIIFINNEALNITGLKMDDVVGKPMQEIAVSNDLIRLLIQDLMNPVASIKQHKQTLKIFADNKESFFEKEIIPIYIVPAAESNTKHIGDVIILQNVTPFKELDSAKTNFIATVSHELKTPISSILMSLELLENDKIGEVNTEQRQLIQSVKEDSQRLLQIIGELLDLTQVETGKIQLHLQNTSPQVIIKYAVDAVKVQADQKNISLEIHCPDSIHSIQADPEKTAWVLTNLLSNAIRYSFENSKVVLSVEDLHPKICFSIQDFGQGIDTKYQEKIFDRYFQIPGSNSVGSGLGLAISKEFIEAQGGHISLQSEIGKGSTFSVFLNRA